MFAALAELDEGLDAHSDRPLWALPEADLLAALDAAHVREQRAVAAKLALVREVDGRGLAARYGCTSTAVLLRERLRLPVQAGRRLVTTASLLDRAPEPVRAALDAGAITVEQALVIAETIADLPTDGGGDPDALRHEDSDRTHPGAEADDRAGAAADDRGGTVGAGAYPDRVDSGPTGAGVGPGLGDRGGIGATCGDAG
ncbi:DUF222 domain-containing protein, partial [Micromonospora zhanjiangensis]